MIYKCKMLIRFVSITSQPAKRDRQIEANRCVTYYESGMMVVCSPVIAYAADLNSHVGLWCYIYDKCYSLFSCWDYTSKHILVNWLKITKTCTCIVIILMTAEYNKQVSSWLVQYDSLTCITKSHVIRCLLFQYRIG